MGAVSSVALDQADDSIEIIDPATGRFLDSNEKAFSSLGYTRQEHRSLTVPDIDPIVTAPIFAQYMARIRESGPLTLETVHRRKDGSTFPVEVNARLVQFDRNTFWPSSATSPSASGQRKHSPF